jgi:hypothetical protein
VYTNPRGVSITIGDAELGITSLTGLDLPDVISQGQRSPYQDGETSIDQLFDTRTIDVEGAFLFGRALAAVHAKRRVMLSALNTKLGVGTLVYTSDAGSWRIGARPDIVEFENNNVNSGSQKFLVSFYCPSPYWEDVTETVITLASDGPDVAVEITGDVETSIVADIEGISSRPSLAEKIQDKMFRYNSIVENKLTVDTGFGRKSAVMDLSDSWRITYNSSPGLKVRSNDIVAVRVGSNGTIYTSIDGHKWIARSSGTIVTLYDVCFSESQDKWIAVGQNGIVCCSKDAYTWEVCADLLTSSALSVFYSEEKNL